jgi:hypothetical protein
MKKYNSATFNSECSEDDSDDERRIADLQKKKLYYQNLKM